MCNKKGRAFSAFTALGHSVVRDDVVASANETEFMCGFYFIRITLEARFKAGQKQTETFILATKSIDA